MDKKLMDKIQGNWILASQRFNFILQSPYFINYKGEKIEVFAYLPNHGSKNGILVHLTAPPKFETDNRIIDYAKENGCSYSFLNTESYSEYRDELYLETLNDWGKM